MAGSRLTSRGLEWDMAFTAVVDNQLVCSGSSTYLYQCETEVSRRLKPKTTRGDNPQDWMVPKDIGRRYGILTRGYNPIHVSNLTARFFGFKYAVAQASRTNAACLAALQD